MPWTVVDAAVPFVPAAVWVYVSIHFLVMGSFFSLEGADRVRRFITAYLCALAVGVTVHWFLPTELPREAWPVLGDSLTAQALAKLRELDTPTSCLPSMHVAFSWLAALALWKSSARRFAFGAAWAAAITASTMLTKQHYLADVAGGLVLAVAVWWVFLALPELAPRAVDSALAHSRARSSASQ
jgi:membrane-associated phospholipid phosphatase